MPSGSHSVPISGFLSMKSWGWGFYPFSIGNVYWPSNFNSYFFCLIFLLFTFVHSDHIQNTHLQPSPSVFGTANGVDVLRQQGSLPPTAGTAGWPLGFVVYEAFVNSRAPHGKTVGCTGSTEHARWPKLVYISKEVITCTRNATNIII